jgi:ketosteroid isomerase-like protein
VAAELAAIDLIEIRLALGDLNAAFAHHLDHGEIDALVDLFTDDALYTHGARRSSGKSAIADFFARRTAAGPRTARHICSGLRLEIEDGSCARGASVCLTFAQNGLPPLPAEPFLVADFDDVYRRCSDGRWRFRERHITDIFVNPKIPPPGGTRGVSS